MPLRLRPSVIRIVLMDIMMPDMDGYQPLQILRGDPRFKDLPALR